jgi:putative transferase (TIGR04331 family)
MAQRLSERLRPDLLPVLEFDRLLDTVYPLLNDLHQVRESRRYWAILLHKHLRRCEIAGIVNDPDSIRRDDGADALLGTRLGGGPQAGAVREAQRTLSQHALSRFFALTSLKRSRSLLCEFHIDSVGPIARRIDRPIGWWTSAVRQSPIASRREQRLALRELSKIVQWPLARLALDCLPRHCVEDFAGRNSNVIVTAPERKIIHTSFLEDPQSVFVTARYVVEGAQLNFYQHGCGYGEIEGYAPHHIESTMADRFMTWGWRLRPTDVPFFALRFMRSRRDRLQPGSPDARPLYVTQRSTFPWEVNDTLDLQDRFFSSLAPSVARMTIVRPRMQKGPGWECQISHHVRQVVAGIDDGTRTFNDVASRCGLIVFDALPSTSFLECLHVGHPALVIASESIPFTTIAKPFYDEFFRLGLLHRTPESAAAFINGTSIATWWRSVSRGDCMRDFVKTFCRLSR